MMNFEQSFDEIEALLSKADTGIDAMPERVEQEVIGSVRAGVTAVGIEAFNDMLFELVVEKEAKLRLLDSPAAKYCLEWLEEQRAEREVGFRG